MPIILALADSGTMAIKPWAAVKELCNFDCFVNSNGAFSWESDRQWDLNTFHVCSLRFSRFAKSRE